MTAASKEATLHLEYLDGIRALLAVYVVIHHAFMHFKFGNNATAYYLYIPFRFGHYAVGAFIVLSGFCLMLPVVQNNGYIKGGATQFFIRRAKRILPPYYLATLFSLLLIATVIGEKTGTIWDISLPADARSIASHGLLIQDIFIHTKSRICYALWSVSVEFRIYFLFPLLILSWRRLGPDYTTAATIIVSFIAWLLLIHTSLNTGPAGINPQYAGLFSLGMLSCYLAFPKENQRVKYVFTNKKIVAIALIVVLIFSTGILVNSQQGIVGSLAIKDLAVGIFFSGFITFVAARKYSIVQKLCSTWPLAKTGRFAYSIYLIHAPLLQLLWQYLVHPLKLTLLQSIALLALGGTAVVIAISYLFYLMAEKPFITRRKIAV